MNHSANIEEIPTTHRSSYMGGKEANVKKLQQETARLRMENEAMKDIIKQKEKAMWRREEDAEIAKLQRKQNSKMD